MVRPIMGSYTTHINDRFFINNSLGYTHIGHTEDPNAPVDQSDLKVDNPKYTKLVVGDDLGSENFALFQTRLDFIDIPFIKKIGMKTFIYGELAFYPPFLSKMSGFSYIYKNIRFSSGFGIAIPVNPLISILIYYNALNLNSYRHGDYERHNIINVSLGFF